MIVRCNKDIYEGRGLIAGKEYHVLSIEKGWYRIVSELGEDYLFPPELFEIIDERNMNKCVDCIVYKVHHNQAKPEICNKCGKRSLEWFQSKSGTMIVKCSNCDYTAAVDLNTPCEEDHELFRQRITVRIDPGQGKIDKRSIISLAKNFEINSIQMLERLNTGFQFDTRLYDLHKYIRAFQQTGISYSAEYDDPRQYYPYYHECGYLYSAMNLFLDEWETEGIQ